MNRLTRALAALLGRRIEEPQSLPEEIEGGEDWGGPEDRFVWEPGDWEDYQ